VHVLALEVVRVGMRAGCGQHRQYNKNGNDNILRGSDATLQLSGPQHSTMLARKSNRRQASIGVRMPA
jgi:hypothetical protein